MSNDVRCSKMLLFSRVFEGLEAVHIQEVTGSSPVVPTKKSTVQWAFSLFPENAILPFDIKFAKK